MGGALGPVGVTTTELLLGSDGTVIVAVGRLEASPVE